MFETVRLGQLDTGGGRGFRHGGDRVGLQQAAPFWHSVTMEWRNVKPGLNQCKPRQKTM